MSLIILSKTNKVVLTNTTNNSRTIVLSYEDIGPVYDISNIIWDARGYTKDEKKEITNYIENYCLISHIDLIDNTDDTIEWLKELFPNKHTMYYYDIETISIPDCKVYTETIVIKRLVVSNVCWSPIYEDEMFAFLNANGCNHVNIALSMYNSNIDVHFVENLKQKLDAYNIHTHSINAIFYNKQENIFVNGGNFISHFKKYLDYATILCASVAIYGSSHTKNINNMHIIKTYNSYTNLNAFFANILQKLGVYAISKKLIIILKPNSKCPYLFENEQTKNLVNMIDNPNIIAGNLRDNSTIVNYSDFTLIEFPPFQDITSAKNYILHLLHSAAS